MTFVPFVHVRSPKRCEPSLLPGYLGRREDLIVLAYILDTCYNLEINPLDFSLMGTR